MSVAMTLKIRAAAARSAIAPPYDKVSAREFKIQMKV
jgi:hypothetical protein